MTAFDRIMSTLDSNGFDVEYTTHHLERTDEVDADGEIIHKLYGRTRINFTSALLRPTETMAHVLYAMREVTDALSDIEIDRVGLNWEIAKEK